ncbi:MAG: flotillin family protein [Alphaproteobacteria bacterium]|nr:flotillin family protein [Alphaproteobacteria bacterium]
MFYGLTDILIMVGVILIALVTMGLIFSRLYKRSSKEVAFVRTGLGGQKVIMNGGALVFPVLHEIIPVNMNTMRLEVRRADEQALITRDRMRVDVLAEFYTRVQPTIDSIANAAQTLGQRTMIPDALRELVEGKFVDALRAVAAEMAMEELHEQRVNFVQKVQVAVSEDLLKNGLELEAVSLTGLDQTNREFFNPDNAFDAAGLTRLTSEIEEKRKRRNDIERDTQVAIEQKNLEAERLTLEISRETEYARLQQEREVEVRRASQSAEIKGEQADKEREAQEAEISASQKVESAKILAERQVEEERIEKDRLIKERDIGRAKSVETTEVDRVKTVELANQDRAIAIAEKSKAQSEAEAEADKARAGAVKAEEMVTTAREIERVEREKAVDLVEARRAAERDAIKVTIAAEAEKEAAEDEAGSIRILANAAAEKVRLVAEGEADAERLRVAAAELRYAVEAAGNRALNEAENLLTSEIVEMKVRVAIIEHLKDIIHESVKPMEKIDGIKIVQVDGLTGNGGNGGGGAANGGGSLADQVVSSALQYRSQAPLIDALMKEIGLSGSDLDSLAAGVKSGTEDAGETPPSAE